MDIPYSCMYGGSFDGSSIMLPSIIDGNAINLLQRSTYSIAQDRTGQVSKSIMDYVLYR